MDSKDHVNRPKIYYFSTRQNGYPVKDFINSLDHRSQQRFFGKLEILKKYGRALSEPHVKYIGDEIFELRFVGIEGAVRVLYFFYDQDKIILTNGFLKKSHKIPAKEKRLAVRRRKEYWGQL